jgi:hypothetical protein
MAQQVLHATPEIARAKMARDYRTGLANVIAAAGLLSCGSLVILWYVVMWVGE